MLLYLLNQIFFGQKRLLSLKIFVASYTTPPIKGSTPLIHFPILAMLIWHFQHLSAEFPKSRWGRGPIPSKSTLMKASKSILDSSSDHDNIANDPLKKTCPFFAVLSSAKSWGGGNFAWWPPPTNLGPSHSNFLPLFIWKYYSYMLIEPPWISCNLLWLHPCSNWRKCGFLKVLSRPYDPYYHSLADYILKGNSTCPNFNENPPTTTWVQ